MLLGLWQISKHQVYLKMINLTSREKNNNLEQKTSTTGFLLTGTTRVRYTWQLQ